MRAVLVIHRPYVVGERVRVECSSFDFCLKGGCRRSNGSSCQLTVDRGGKVPGILQILRSRLIETLNVRDGYRPAVSRYTGRCTQARDRAVERCDPAECRASMFE
jgi:hypothetical protein